MFMDTHSHQSNDSLEFEKKLALKKLLTIHFPLRQDIVHYSEHFFLPNKLQSILLNQLALFLLLNKLPV